MALRKAKHARRGINAGGGAHRATSPDATVAASSSSPAILTPLEVKILFRAESDPPSEGIPKGGRAAKADADPAPGATFIAAVGSAFQRLGHEFVVCNPRGRIISGVSQTLGPGPLHVEHLLKTPQPAGRNHSSDRIHCIPAALGRRGRHLLVVVERHISLETRERQILTEEWGLTARQVEIFFAVRSGEKRTVVAERLKQRITLRTVEEHLRRIYARVGVHDWCELEAKLRSALARPT